MSLEQEGFRWRNDDGVEEGSPGASWKAAQDANISLAADTAVRLRVLVNHQSGAAPGASNYRLEYRLVGSPDSPWLEVEPTGSPDSTGRIRLRPSAYIIASGENTTAQLAAPAGSPKSFTAGRIWDDESGQDSITIGLDQYTELEFCIEAVTANGAAANDVYEFRVTRRTAAASGQLASDDFTRADAATLGANWTNKNSAPGIFSNQVDITITGDENLAYYNGVVWPADQYSQATVKAAPAANRAAAVVVRADTGANRTGYFGGYDQAQSGDGNRRIWKFVGTTWTDLGTDGVPVALNDVIKLTVTGANPCTLKLYVNGVEKISVATDSDYDTGNAGLAANNSAGNVALLDDWSGGAP